MRLVKWFKRQNLAIKVGYIALIFSLIFLCLALILIGTANFVPNDAQTAPNWLVGNGFSLIYKNGIAKYLSVQGYWDFKTAYSASGVFAHAPLVQLIVGIIFLVILLPIAGGIALLALLGGYFKRWLYT